VCACASRGVPYGTYTTWVRGEGEQNGDELSVRKLSINISSNWENVCGSKAVDRRHGGDADGVWSGVNRAPRGLMLVSGKSPAALNRI